MNTIIITLLILSVIIGIISCILSRCRRYTEDDRLHRLELEINRLINEDRVAHQILYEQIELFNKSPDREQKSDELDDPC